MFKNIKLGTKLIGGFSIVVILFIGVMIIYHLAILFATSVFGNLVDVDMAIANHTSRAEVLMLTCRRSEKDFLSHLDKTYQEELERNINDLKKEAQAIIKLAKQTNDRQTELKATQVISHIQTYAELFNQIVAAYEKKGFNDKSGLRGKFAKAIESMNEDMKHHDIELLYIDALKFSFLENKYIKSPEEETKEKLLKAIKDSYIHIEQAPKGSATRDSFSEILPEYEKAAKGYFDSQTDEEKEKYYATMQENLNEMIEFLGYTYLPSAKEIILEIRKNEKDYMITKDPKYVQATHDAITAMLKVVHESSVAEDFVTDAEVFLDDYKKAFDAIVAEDKIIQTLLDQMNTAVDKIGPLVSQMNKEANQEAMQKKKVAEDEVKSRSLLAVIIGGIAVLLGILLSWFITRQITGPTNKAVDFSNALSKGDFTQKLKVTHNDEIGILSKALNAMVSNLSAMIKDITKVVDTLSSSSNQLTLISDQMYQSSEETTAKSITASHATKEMSSNFNAVAQTMEQTASKVSSVASATEGIMQTIDDIAKKTDTAIQIAQDAVLQAQSASGKMEELRQSAQDIGNVSQAISDISEQTNLLALNATIEAARAGDSGRGFAVVANEIKELAKQTATATQEIKVKIETIQGTTNGTEKEIMQISKVIDDVNEIITSIGAAMQTQLDSTREIAENIAQTSSGIQEVNDSVNKNSVAAEGISNDVEGVNQAAGKISDNSSYVKKSAEDLLALAENLKEMVSMFRL